MHVCMFKNETERSDRGVIMCVRVCVCVCVCTRALHVNVCVCICVCVHVSGSPSVVRVVLVPQYV
jgi:hypothetical protein